MELIITNGHFISKIVYLGAEKLDAEEAAGKGTVDEMHPQYVPLKLPGGLRLRTAAERAGQRRHTGMLRHHVTDQLFKVTQPAAAG